MSTTQTGASSALSNGRPAYAAPSMLPPPSYFASMWAPPKLIPSEPPPPPLYWPPPPCYPSVNYALPPKSVEHYHGYSMPYETYGQMVPPQHVHSPHYDSYNPIHTTHSDAGFVKPVAGVKRRLPSEGFEPAEHRSTIETAVSARSSDVKTSDRPASDAGSRNGGPVLRSATAPRDEAAVNKYRGVSVARSGRWRVQVGFRGKRINVGHFAMEEEENAARTYDCVVRILHARQSMLNFPDEIISVQSLPRQFGKAAMRALQTAVECGWKPPDHIVELLASVRREI